jgi:hypothetical protein
VAANRRDLLFDTDHIKDEYRSDWNKLIKRHAYFFKHADRDGDSVIDFDPDMNEWYTRALFGVARPPSCRPVRVRQL